MVVWNPIPPQQKLPDSTTLLDGIKFDRLNPNKNHHKSQWIGLRENLNHRFSYISYGGFIGKNFP